MDAGGDAVAIRVLGAADLAAYRALRREAVTLAPVAFLTTPAEDAAISDAEVLRRLAEAWPSAVFGAFVGDDLVGMAGFGANEREKQRHRGTLWGVYVQPAQRGRGIARDLVRAVIEHAAQHARFLDAVVSGGNAEARALYDGLGFERYGVVPSAQFAEGAFHDDILIGLLLDRPKA